MSDELQNMYVAHLTELAIHLDCEIRIEDCASVQEFADVVRVYYNKRWNQANKKLVDLHAISVDAIRRLNYLYYSITTDYPN